MHGKGTQYYEDGTVYYEGGWLSDLPEGRGKVGQAAARGGEPLWLGHWLTDSGRGGGAAAGGGRRVQAYHTNGKLWFDGQYSKGLWANGTEFYDNGKRAYTGSWVNTKRSGKGTSYYRS